MYKIVVMYHSGKEAVQQHSSFLIAEHNFDKYTKDPTVKRVILKQKNKILRRHG